MPCWRSAAPSAMRLAMLMMLLGLATAAAQLDRPATPVERVAWDALASGQIHQAAVAFAEAISRDPGNARLHFGAGLAATAERRDADARDEFEKALALDSRLSDARRRLGLVQDRLGELSAAIQTGERAGSPTAAGRAGRIRHREPGARSGRRRAVRVSVRAPDAADIRRLSGSAVELVNDHRHAAAHNGRRPEEFTVVHWFQIIITA